MFQKIFKNLLILCFIILYPVKGIAYDTDIVHPILNEQASRQSTNLGMVLQNLGFSNGVDSIVKNKRIYLWFREGGIKEDETVCRAKFHFHDPTISFDSAGLSNILVDTICLDYRRKSSVVWAQDEDNLWSWQKAREYYFEALTGSDKDLKDKRFADTFRSLGQVMHLIADSSVPEHTRNDIHIFPLLDNTSLQLGRWTYETWCKYNIQNLNIAVNAINYSITNNSWVSGLIPITNFWDTTPSPGYNLNPIGLAEYSNLNFLSKDTIFKDYTYPQKPNTYTLEPITSEDGKTDYRVYYSGVTTDGQNVKYLASTGYLWSELSTADSNGIDDSRLNLDDKSFENYASILVPKAVGYSAGLLNYFFRGTLEITAPDTYVYSIIDGSINPQQFTKIKAKVMNTTPNEQMQAGVLQAIAKYKKRTDYAPDLSTDPPTQTSREPEYSYSVSAQWTLSSTEISSINTAPTEFTFNFTGSPIPAGITDLYLIVVFKGTLGNEVDTAIAAGMKDLKEPTHHTFWNLTDRFSLGIYDDAASAYIYHLYKSDEIKSNPDLAKLVDKDGDGIFNEISDPIKPEPYIDPYDIAFNISYMESSSPANPPISTATVVLPPGRYMRLIVLVDRKYNNHVRMGWSDNIDTNNAKYDTLFEGIINQDINGVWQTPTPVIIFRGIRQHFYTGLLRCEPLAYDPTTMITYCPYPKEEEPAPADTTPYQATINFK